MAHLNGGHKQTKSRSFFIKFASVLLCFGLLTSIRIASHCKHGSCMAGFATVKINFGTRKISINFAPYL